MLSLMPNVFIKQKKVRKKDRYRGVKSSEKRLRVLYRDNYICRYCGFFGDTVDHIIPHSKGGTDDESNLVCACEECNIKKDNTIPSDLVVNIYPVFQHGSANIGEILQSKLKQGR